MTTGFTPGILLAPLEPFAIPANLEVAGVPPVLILGMLTPPRLPAGGEARGTLLLANSLPVPVRSVSGVIEIGGQEAAVFDDQTLLPVGLISFIEVDLTMPNLLGNLSVDVDVDWFGSTVSRPTGNIQLLEPPGPGVEQVVVTPPHVDLVPGQTQQFTATGLLSDGTERDLTLEVAWDLTNTEVGVITPAGLFTAGLAGRVGIVRARYSGVVFGAATVRVNEPSGPLLETLTLVPTGATLEVGQTRQFTAFGAYSDSQVLDLSDLVSWNSSNSNVATIDASGLLTAVNPGGTQISVSLLNIVSPPATVVVESPPPPPPPDLTSLTVSPASVSVEVDQVQQFGVLGRFSDGEELDLTPDAAWSSSNPSVASIDSTGLALARSAGFTNITASFQGITSNLAPLEVLPKPWNAGDLVVNSVTATPDVIHQGDPLQLTLNISNPLLKTGVLDIVPQIIAPTQGDIGAGLSRQVNILGQDNFNLTFSASAINTRDIGAWGVRVLALEIDPDSGNVLETITDTTFNNVFSMEAVLERLEVEPLAPSLEPGLTLPFTALGVVDDGSRVDLTSDVLWNSSNRNVATIDANGVATGVAEGTTTITASLGTIVSQGITLVVEVIEAVLQSITLAPEQANLEIGRTQQIQATGHYDDGSENILTSLVDWQSSDNSVATVDENGLVTAVDGGSAEITATLAGITSAISTLIDVLVAFFTIANLEADNLEALEGETVTFTISVLNDSQVAGPFEANTRIVDSAGAEILPFSSEPFSLNIGAGLTGVFREPWEATEAGNFFYEVWDPLLLLGERLGALAFSVLPFGPPLLRITAPTVPPVINGGEFVTFAAEATSVDGTDLSETIEWFRNGIGPIWQASTFPAQFNDPGVQLIVAKVIDPRTQFPWLVGMAVTVVLPVPEALRVEPPSLALDVDETLPLRVFVQYSNGVETELFGTPPTRLPEFAPGETVTTPRTPPEREVIADSRWEEGDEIWFYAMVGRPGTYWQESLLTRAFIQAPAVPVFTPVAPLRGIVEQEVDNIGPASREIYALVEDSVTGVAYGVSAPFEVPFGEAALIDLEISVPGVGQYNAVLRINDVLAGYEWVSKPFSFVASLGG